MCAVAKWFDFSQSTQCRYIAMFLYEPQIISNPSSTNRLLI